MKLSKKQLKKTADKILKHIYGPAGLVMQMETRDAAIYVWEICEEFQNKEIDLDQLENAFYYVRRYLRADLQLDDIEEINSE